MSIPSPYQRTTPRPTWRATAWDRNPAHRQAKALHQTYLRASSTEKAKQAAQMVLRTFVRGRFHVTVAKATPQELGCVPTGSKMLSSEVI